MLGTVFCMKLMACGPVLGAVSSCQLAAEKFIAKTCNLLSYALLVAPAYKTSSCIWLDACCCNSQTLHACICREFMDRLAMCMDLLADQRAAQAFRLRYGIVDGRQRTLEQVGKALKPKVSPATASELVRHFCCCTQHSLQAWCSSALQHDLLVSICNVLPGLPGSNA